MEKVKKKNIVRVIDEIFAPLGFKQQRNNWIFNGDELCKLINLQKSKYSNAFYINYGYIIKNLELTTTTHVENRLASIDKEEQIRITELLDLETEIPVDQRLAELKRLITDKIALPMLSVNLESDLLNELRKRSNLNDIPLVVKQHYHLSE